MLVVILELIYQGNFYIVMVIVIILCIRFSFAFFKFIFAGESVQSNLCLLSKVQQLNISCKVSPAEQKMLKTLQLSDIDTEVVNSLVAKDSQPEGEVTGKD